MNLVDAVAAYRLTKLVTDDVVTEPVRSAIVGWAYDRETRILPTDHLPISERDVMDLSDLLAVDGPEAPRLAYLVTCRWCAGIYVSAAVVAARRLAPRAWAPIADALAVSAAAALLARLED